MAAPILILDAHQIQARLRRMAWQLCEQLYGEDEVLLVGVAGAGYVLAQSLTEELNAISDLRVETLPLYMNKRNPVEEICLNANLEGRAIVLVDDVAHSGRTLLYALRPLLLSSPSRVLIAVLVDRRHKRFPVTPDVVGYSLATTIEENIRVDIQEARLHAAFLE